MPQGSAPRSQPPSDELFVRVGRRFHPALLESLASPIRDAFYAAHRQLVLASSLHFVLRAAWTRVSQRSASRIVKCLAELRRGAGEARWSVEAVERDLMTARHAQSFHRGDDAFTCAHQAVLRLAVRIAFAAEDAMVPPLRDDPRSVAAGNALLTARATADKKPLAVVEEDYQRFATTCGVVTENGEPGEEWPVFLDRYAECTEDLALGRPQFRLSPTAIAAFEAGRQAAKPEARRPKRSNRVLEYY